MGRDNVGAQRVENCPLSLLPRQAAVAVTSGTKLTHHQIQGSTKHPSVPVNVSSKKQGLNVSKGKKTSLTEL